MRLAPKWGWGGNITLSQNQVLILCINGTGNVMEDSSVLLHGVYEAWEPSPGKLPLVLTTCDCLTHSAEGN